MESKKRLHRNSGKENQEKVVNLNDKENIVKVNLGKENIEEDTAKESLVNSNAKPLCSGKDNGSKMPLENKDTNVKAT